MNVNQQQQDGDDDTMVGLDIKIGHQVNTVNHLRPPLITKHQTSMM